MPYRPVLRLGTCLLLAASCLGFAQEVRPPDFDHVVVAKNVMAPMRDGVELAADIYRPGRDGEAVPSEFPVLLTRTVYGKFRLAESAEFLARRGYVVVIQDIRGRFESEGEFLIYQNEGPDGYDTVEWVAGQPWSNGDVGVFGVSYYAATQNALAVENPPHLKSMFQRVGTANYWEDGAGGGGAFTLRHNLAYAIYLASRSKEALADPALAAELTAYLEEDALGQWMLAYPFRPGASPLASIPGYQSWFQEWVDNQVYNDYWKQNGYNFEVHHDKYPDIPIYIGGGWYDIFLRGTFSNYQGLSALHNSPTRLLVGPWEHAVEPRVTGDVDFGASAAFNIEAERLRWFDATLKNVDNGMLDEAPVRVFIMGGGDGQKTADGHLSHGGEWVTFSDWPPPAASEIVMYLHGDGDLSQEKPGSGIEPTVYTYDPNDPVPSIGGKVSSGSDLTPPGPFNQVCSDRYFGCDNDLPLSARRDVLVFQTEPLQEDVVVAGPVKVKLWVASSATDTDFTAKLIDVHPPSADYPGGYSMPLADRIIRARYRDSLEKAELMKPGRVYEVEIDLLGIANSFQKGHRIRLDISSSNFPFYDANPNTGERLGYHTDKRKAVNSIYHDARRPSALILPVLEMRPGQGN